MPRHDFKASVHSVFAAAANLRPEKGSRLLTLLTAGCADLPQGIRLATPQGFSFDKELHPGDQLICHNNFLADERERLSIDMHQAKRWTCWLPRLDAEAITPLVMAAWTLAWQVLLERQNRINACIPIEEQSTEDFYGLAAMSGKMDAKIRELVDAARNLDLSESSSISGLVGLGYGLTPSGDDFLVGFLTGLRCTAGKKPDRLAYLSALGNMVVRVSRQTNEISRTYLFHATRGQVSSRLVDLAEAIALGEYADHVRQVTLGAMQVGHSSGMEMVSGLLFGLSTWGKGLPEVQNPITIEVIR